MQFFLRSSINPILQTGKVRPRGCHLPDTTKQVGSSQTTARASKVQGRCSDLWSFILLCLWGSGLVCPVNNLYSEKENWWVKEIKNNLENSHVKYLLISLPNEFWNMSAF